MNQLRWMTLSLSVTLSLVLPFSALAQNAIFCTITVPVKLSRIHKDIEAAKVFCGVWREEAAAKKFDMTKVVATGLSAPIKLKSANGGLRSFNGKTAVALNKRNANDKNTTDTATHWACDLVFDYTTANARPGSANSKKPVAIKAAARTRYVPRVSGVLPGA